MVSVVVGQQYYQVDRRLLLISVSRMFASKEKQRNVIHVLIAKAAGVQEVHQQIKAMYGEHGRSLTHVQDCRKFLLC